MVPTRSQVDTSERSHKEFPRSLSIQLFALDVLWESTLMSTTTMEQSPTAAGTQPSTTTSVEKPPIRADAADGRLEAIRKSLKRRMMSFPGEKRGFNVHLI